MFSKRWILFTAVALLCVTACTIKPPAGHQVGDQIDMALQQDIQSNQALDKKEHAPLPLAVSAALVPDISTNKLPGVEKTQQRRFDINVKDVPAQLFFTGLVKGTKLSMTVGPNVTGTITLDLKSVTIQQVMDAARDVYGYEYRRTSYGYQVLEKQLQTRVFTINYLDMTRSGESQTTISTGQITRHIAPSAGSEEEGSSGTAGGTETSPPSSSINTSSTSDFWASLRESLTAMVGTEGGHSVVINPQAGMIVVRAYPNELREIAEYLDSTQASVKRQVIIEARVLEIELSAAYQSGIDWTLFDFKQTGNKKLTDNLDVFTNAFELSGSGKYNFSYLIKALQDQGRVNVLSSPRISTLNNEQAVIKVGKDRFFVTGVTSNTVAGGSAIETTQNIDLTPFFSGIALDVTPEIGKNDSVTLHVHPMVSTVVDEERTFEVNDKAQKLPLAKSTIRETDSVVNVQDGQVIAIGGLMENKSTDYGGGTPIISDIPGAGPLVSDQNKTSSKFELVILLKATVVKDGTWTVNLKKTAEEFEETKGNFSYSARVKQPPLPRKH